MVTAELEVVKEVAPLIVNVPLSVIADKAVLVVNDAVLVVSTVPKSIAAASVIAMAPEADAAPAELSALSVKAPKVEAA